MSDDLIIPLSPAEILAYLKTIDGVGSGLDADLVRGQQIASQYRISMRLHPMLSSPARTLPQQIAAYIARY